eukprot:s332_g57.t1
MCHQLFLWAAGLALAGSNTACLPNATEELDRKELVNLVSGLSYAIGLWRNGDYPAAHLTARVVQIIIQERLGYKVELKGPGALTLDGFFALMGCSQPLNGTNRGCGPSVTYVHINVEVWTVGYAAEWTQIQAQYPNKAPKNLGNMGYKGVSSAYVPLAVQQKAYEVESINLDFYRDYNKSRQNPAAYFAAPSELDVSKLLPCGETALMSNEVMSTYFDISGDSAGVVVDNGVVVGKCFDGYFWYAPTCREDPGTCFTWFTAGTGWGMNELLIKAAVYNMPLAAAVASSWENYVNMPKDFNFMLYWWVPDPTFLRLNPKRIIFPEHDPDAFAQGDRRTAVLDVSIDKLVSQDLSDLAPDVEAFMDRFQISLKSVNEMMLNQLDTGDADFDVACRWLLSNEDRWTTWLPEKGKCFSQFGMYSEKEQRFLQTRETISITCRACPSGFYSAELEDSQGTTFICLECPSGSFQASGASVSCDLCPTGSYQNETKSLGCNRCPVGQYQNEEGQRGCKQCPPGATTLLLGSNSMSDCGCAAGSINIAIGEALECIPCREGLDCPFSSSIRTLQTGQPSSGEQLVTRIQSGYFGTMKDPLKVFRCRPSSWCPGGTPGTCAGGLQGEPCAICPDGKGWNGEECGDCGAAAVGWAVAGLAVLAGTRSAYFFVNVAVTAQATPFKTAQMAVGVIVSSLQSIALLGLMSTKWPATFEKTSSGLQFFVLDMDSLGLACFVGGTSEISYVATAFLCPAILLWLAICHVSSKLSCFRRCGLQRWKWPFTLNTVGLGLQLGFGSIAAVSLKPMMCYRHPNGRHSVLSYPTIFCGESGHGLLLGCGIGLLTLFVLGFMVICSYAVWNLPRWSVEGKHQRVQSFRFCTSNFRFGSYGFIVPLLCRGLGFALSIVAGTNLPPLQTSLVSIVLVTYTVAQASLRPWKGPAINGADTASSVALLILAGRSLPVDGDMEAEFAEYFTLFILMLLLACLASLVLVCAAGMVLQLAGGDWSRLLSLGRSHDASKITRALELCAQGLLELESDHLRKQIGTMNSYDVMTILNFISIIGADFQDESRLSQLSQRSSILPGRVRLLP